VTGDEGSKACRCLGLTMMTETVAPISVVAFLDRLLRSSRNPRRGEMVLTYLLDHPRVLCIVTFFVLWVVNRIGRYLNRIRPQWLESDMDDFNLVLGATLTMLGLLIGFTFSMAAVRYDQRKNFEEEEANAIGTEYVRADTLPAPEAAKVRALLKDYVSERIVYYTIYDADLLSRAAAKTHQLQSNLWSTVMSATSGQRDAISALAVSGANDVLNAEGYTAAAWRNRIPLPAWLLMFSIAIVCNLLLGFRARRGGPLQLVLPVAVAISFFLIADIDSPRSGIIRVRSQNLESLLESFH
jgi:hypothetical protein